MSFYCHWACKSLQLYLTLMTNKWITIYTKRRFFIGYNIIVTFVGNYSIQFYFYHLQRHNFKKVMNTFKALHVLTPNFSPHVTSTATFRHFLAQYCIRCHYSLCYRFVFLSRKDAKRCVVWCCHARDAAATAGMAPYVVSLQFHAPGHPGGVLPVI